MRTTWSPRSKLSISLLVGCAAYRGLSARVRILAFKLALQSELAEELSWHLVEASAVVGSVADLRADHVLPLATSVGDLTITLGTVRLKL